MIDQLDTALALATVQSFVVNDKAADGARIIRDCPVIVLAERIGAPGSYNDRWTVTHRDGWSRSFQANTDPGRVGWYAAIKKYYARQRPGLWSLVRGTHKTTPRCFVQPRDSDAASIPLRSYYSDLRAKGWCQIDRMKDATTIAESPWGRFGINAHPGASDTRTGSAGCQTAAPKVFAEVRDLIYRYMDESRQPFLPWLLVSGPV